MWDRLAGVLPNYLVMFCTVLSFVIPYVIYKVNQQLHRYGDPPWKHSKYETDGKNGNRSRKK